ncbi:sensor domain-containing diguanylate cyclase [Candidatus Sulfurimonas baltica]|uniref:diguanylate cyclase n=1 Tax=Candidatus Sulfurimonas baltica TaxID=2740404 RepID=A0A7S7LZD3_9BACT|nr:cache domain-containing protein [Candidatus Sulfurimonas baltica]QOY53329.1 cache domain-containing protein [Candidatus Sulfurimonas baltica]
MFKNSYFLKFLSFGPLLFIPFMVGLLSFFYIQMYNKSFDLSLKELEKDMYEMEMSTSKDKISSVSDLIVYQKSITQEKLKSRVKERVDVAYDVANNIYSKYKDIKSKQEIQNITIASLETLAWNNGESYIFMLDFDGFYKLAPKHLKHLEGTCAINIQDATGKYTVKEEIELCEKDGGGFIWSTNPKSPDSAEHYTYIEYVKAFNHYNWYLGSGEYLDSAIKRTDEELIQTIAKINNIGNRYIFIVHKDEYILFQKEIPDHISKNISDFEKKYTRKAIAKIIMIMKENNSDFVSYNWVNLQTETIEEKLSYVMNVPGTDWIIGTGFYLKDIEQEIALKKSDMYRIYYEKSKKVIYFAVLIMIVTLFISYYVSAKIKQSFSRYERRIILKNLELEELNEELEEKVKDRTRELHKSEYDLKIKNDILEKLSRRDGLTDIANRRYFDESFEIKYKESLREQTSLVIIMIDIDCFKEYNDHYGHAEGDNVLKKVAKTLLHELKRPSDMVARYGGEEFVLLLKGVDIKGAKQVADSLLKAVTDLNIPHDYSIATNVVSISVGVSYTDGDGSIDKEALLKEADDALYEAKNSGRNKVVINNT